MAPFLHHNPTAPLTSHKLPTLQGDPKREPSVTTWPLNFCWKIPNFCTSRIHFFISVLCSTGIHWRCALQCLYATSLLFLNFRILLPLSESLWNLTSNLVPFWAIIKPKFIFGLPFVTSLCSVSRMTKLSIITRVKVDTLSKEPNVCHKLLSILWLLEPICSLTIEYQVFQYVPTTSKSEQYGENTLTILQQISFLLLWLKWWSTMHGVDTLYSCWVVLFDNSQYRSTHFFAWRAMS